MQSTATYYKVDRVGFKRMVIRMGSSFPGELNSYSIRYSQVQLNTSVMRKAMCFVHWVSWLTIASRVNIRFSDSQIRINIKFDVVVWVCYTAPNTIQRTIRGEEGGGWGGEGGGEGGENS